MSSRNGDGESIERRLTALMCSTASRRRSHSQEARELLGSAQPERMIELLRRLHLTVLVGQRLVNAGLDLDARLLEEIELSTASSRQRGGAHELITQAILDRLAAAGIRALALKGSALARDLYHDVAWRRAGDIDILVAARDLAGAIRVVERMDWRWQRAARSDRLPLLHETLTHSSMPRVELHWRVHWYEDRFAADALERAERPSERAPLRMLPADGLATLTLIYARDGLSGLRTPADIAAWWDTRCTGDDVDASIDAIGCDYPALAAPLRVATAFLGPLVGLPTRPMAEPFRWKVATELATPFYEGGQAQVGANASLVDLLLAPPRGSRASVRRELQKVPKDLQRPLSRDDEFAVHRARWEHGLRVLRRWGLAAAPAAVRAFRQQPNRPFTRSGG
jgi:Uncharacterised nucleotidyltransferase